MKNIKAKFEVFVITNGRSTLDYCLESLSKQTVTAKITVLRDRKWVDALNECLDLCESDFYARIDDDMLFHNMLFAYYEKVIGLMSKNIGAYSCKLWEDWTNRPGGFVKLYRTKVARKLGFRVNKLGKSDKPFFKDLSRTKYKHIKDSSLVGLHGCGSWEEQLHYREIWLKDNAKICYDEPKELWDAQKAYGKTPEEQYKLLKNLMVKNRKAKTKFYYFCKKRDLK